jgi:hypothetical protein
MSTDADSSDSSASSDHADTSRRDHLRVVEGCMLALVFIVVAVRLYSRKRFLGRIFCDDICILLSTVRGFPSHLSRILTNRNHRLSSSS